MRTLAEAHIEAEARLRGVTVRAVERLWRELPGYDRTSADQWLSQVLPVVAAAQRQSISLTEAYLARALDRRPIGLRPEDLLGAAVRNGAPPEAVYSRPFVTVWTALKNGQTFEDAVGSGLARAGSTAAMDVQLSMRATAGAVQSVDDNIYGYQRIADAGACEFCSLVDGAYLKSGDAMPLHNNCGCGLEPLTAPHPRATSLPSGVAVRDHGELGPILGDPNHDFTQL